MSVGFNRPLIHVHLIRDARLPARSQVFAKGPAGGSDDKKRHKDQMMIIKQFVIITGFFLVCWTGVLVKVRTQRRCARSERIRSSANNPDRGAKPTVQNVTERLRC